MEGHWKVAQHFELIPELAAAASSFQERELAGKMELSEAKLRKAMQGNFQGRRAETSTSPAQGAGRQQGGRPS